MKKIIALFAALALTLSLASAHADSVHIERRLTDKVSVNADFETGAPKSAPTLRMRIPAFSDSDRISLDGLAEITFWNKSAKIVYKGISESLPGLLRMENAEEELVSIFTESYISSMHAAYYRRYFIAEDYVTDVRNFLYEDDPSILAIPFKEDECFAFSHDSFPIEEANAKAMEVISYVLGDGSPLEPYPLYQYAVSYQQIEQIMDAYRAGNEDTLFMYGDRLHYDGWTEEDNIYFMKYGFKLNGLPIFTNTNGIVYQEDDFPAFPLYATVNLQKNGIFFSDIHFAEPEDTPESELQPLLTPEQACDALAAYYDSIIQTNDYEITRAWTEYFTASSRSERALLEFTPVWAFSVDLVIGDVRYTDYRTIRVNAITGEFII